MDELNLILLYGVAVPAGIAAILMLRSPGRLAAALALPMVAYVLIRDGWTGEARQYVTFAPLVGFACGLMMAFAPRTIGVRAVVAVILGALITAVLWPVFNDDDHIALRLFPGAAAMLLLALTEPMAGPKGQPTLALGLSIGAGAAGAIFIAAYGSWGFGVSMIAMGMALLVISIGMWKRRELTMAAGPLAVVAASFATYPFVTWLYAKGPQGDVAPTAFAILAGLPLLLWAGVPGRNGGEPLPKRGVIRIASVVVACAAAGVFAYIDQRPTDGDDDTPAQMSDDEQSMHDAMMDLMQGGGTGESGGDDSGE